MKGITITTTRGNITLGPEQLAGCKPCTITDARTGQVVDGSEILISIGAIPLPLPEAMRMLAELLEEAQRPPLVLVASEGDLPPLPRLR